MKLSYTLNPVEPERVPQYVSQFDDCMPVCDFVASMAKDGFLQIAEVVAKEAQITQQSYPDCVIYIRNYRVG